MKPAYELAGDPKLLIVDAGGTLFDPGSIVPVHPFQEAFKSALAEDNRPYGLDIKFDSVMKYMGMDKLEHIIKLLGEPEIGKQFNLRFGRIPAEGDSLLIHEDFKKRIYPSASKNKEIPRVKEAAYRLKRAGIPMVMTTGYDRRMVDEIRKFLPWLDDVLFASITTSEIHKNKGRPAPFMIYRALEIAGIENPADAVNVGDTEWDALSADNANMPGIIVTSGSLRNRRETNIANRKIERPHLVLDDLADVIDFTLDRTLADRIRVLNG